MPPRAAILTLKHLALQPHPLLHPLLHPPLHPQILGHSVDEVWCGHQAFPSDAETEAAMLNGVRGCTCFVLLLTRSSLTRPYVHLEARAQRPTGRETNRINHGISCSPKSRLLSAGPSLVSLLVIGTQHSTSPAAGARGADRAQAHRRRPRLRRPHWRRRPQRHHRKVRFRAHRRAAQRDSPAFLT